MTKRFLVVTWVLMLALGGYAALAEETTDDSGSDLKAVESEDYGSVSVFVDGRINAGDMAAPVAIYYTYATEEVFDTDGNVVWGVDGYPYYEDVPTGLEILSINAEGNGDLIMDLSKDALNDALATGQTSFTAAGYTLNIGENGWYWLTAPADSEGKVYSFSWDDLGRTLTTPLVTAS